MRSAASHGASCGPRPGPRARAWPRTRGGRMIERMRWQIGRAPWEWPDPIPPSRLTQAVRGGPAQDLSETLRSLPTRPGGGARRPRRAASGQRLTGMVRPAQDADRGQRLVGTREGPNSWEARRPGGGGYDWVSPLSDHSGPNPQPEPIRAASRSLRCPSPPPRLRPAFPPRTLQTRARAVTEIRSRRPARCGTKRTFSSQPFAPP